SAIRVFIRATELYLTDRGVKVIHASGGSDLLGRAFATGGLRGAQGSPCNLCPAGIPSLLILRGILQAVTTPLMSTGRDCARCAGRISRSANLGRDGQVCWLTGT